MNRKARQREMQALRAAGMTLANAERLAQTKRGSTVALVGIGALAVAVMAGIGVLSLNLPTASDTDPRIVDVSPDPIPTLLPEIAPDLPIETAEAALPEPIKAPAVTEAESELPWVTALTEQVQNTQEAAPTAASAQPVEINCAEQLAADISGVLLQFDPGSATLSPESFDILAQVGALTAACPNARVQVAGHSDSSGTDVANLQLSWTRAENTIEALSALGFDTGQFESVGFGSRAPLTQGSSSEDGVNRRVELRVLKGDTQ